MHVCSSSLKSSLLLSQRILITLHHNKHFKWIDKQILEEHQKNCEHQGKYVEAEIAKNRLDELKAHEEKRQREAMRARQISDMLGVEEAHMVEFKQFNLTRDKKMAEFEEKAST